MREQGTKPTLEESIAAARRDLEAIRALRKNAPLADLVDAEITALHRNLDRLGIGRLEEPRPVLRLIPGGKADSHA
jgi:hypothetical protein